MEHLIKIGNEIFLINEGSVQLSLGTHATIILNLDIKKHPEYVNIFFKKYEMKEKFNILAKLFSGIGTRIKSIDIDRITNQMNLSLRCDILESKTIDERRNELIDILLDIETLRSEDDTNEY